MSIVPYISHLHVNSGFNNAMRSKFSWYLVKHVHVLVPGHTLLVAIKGIPAVTAQENIATLVPLTVCSNKKTASLRGRAVGAPTSDMPGLSCAYKRLGSIPVSSSRKNFLILVAALSAQYSSPAVPTSLFISSPMGASYKSSGSRLQFAMKSQCEPCVLLGLY